MSLHNTHCAVRLGDNLAAVHFLRKLALAYPKEQFRHYACDEYLKQLAPVVEDVPNLSLGDLTNVSEPKEKFWQMAPHEKLHSIDLWKNADGFFDAHPLRMDYGPFMIAYGHWCAQRMGLKSPIKVTPHLLFDYPALKPEKPPCEPFDFLIVNSQPLSGQLPAYSASQFDELIAMLARKYHIVTTQKTGLRVTCTQEFGLDVTQIGQLSQFCRVIIMVATGPCWTTFNVWNQESVKLRVILSGAEALKLTPNTIHTNKVYAVRDVLMATGFL